MHPISPAFEKTRTDYLAQVARMDVNAAADKLGVQFDEEAVGVPLFGETFRITTQEIFDPKGMPAKHSVAVLVCRYLLLCPEVCPHESNWMTYKDFRDAAPFVGGFVNNTEKVIARNFSGKLAELTAASEKIGGRQAGIDLSYDLKMTFSSLPRVPVLMLFNDQDDEFPAQCSVLFEERAARYLDMECIAIIGWLLADLLNEDDHGSGATIM